MALKASFLATGLTIRIHGNTNRLQKHALKLHDVKILITFLNNFAEGLPVTSVMICSCCHQTQPRRYPPERERERERERMTMYVQKLSDCVHFHLASV